MGSGRSRQSVAPGSSNSRSKNVFSALCGKEQVDRFQMRAGHGKNVRRSIDQRDRERLTAKRRDIDSALPANFDRMHARRLSAHRMHTSGIGLDVLAIAKQTAEKSQGHGTAANVAGTDKKDVFHEMRDAAATACAKVKSNVLKSTNPPATCS